MVRALEGRELFYRYPDGASEGAVRGVDVTCEPGSLLALAGRNGAGKSTLLALLGGLLKPERGSVTLGDVDVRGMRSRERARRIAIIPQELRARPDLTTIDFLRSGRYAWQERFRGQTADDERRVREALGCCGIEAFAERAISELSGGERQRALIARALVQDGEVLLVDEPTSSLDAEHQLRTFTDLHALARGGKAVVVVTHDLNLASQFADQVVLLDAGQVVAHGTPGKVLTPEHLRPLYGDDLHFDTLDSAAAGERRPFVLSWRRSSGRDSS